MRPKMSTSSRQELLLRTALRYRNATWTEKGRILNEFVAATGYSRKRAISLLNHPPLPSSTPQKRSSPPRRYDPEVQQALITVWKAANRLCSKRLVPFLPEFVTALERFGHLTLTPPVRENLLSISAARLLYHERHPNGQALSTTRPGQLLKHQIPVRTFADWNEVAPGFVEADLVAHCGDNVGGCFLYTLTLTDIATGWTECVALLHRSEADVTGALNEVRKVLPFPLLGLDTDNGGEFINYEMLRYCEREKITFTRGRPYKKNDQAHVEQKNGSVVRRLVGYDRYEGVEAWRALAAVYRVLRLYLNFFQPSLKLASKQREGARVTKQYDKAQTPYQRVLASTALTEEQKERLRRGYEQLDPLALLSELQRQQDQFWQHAWKEAGRPTAIPQGDELPTSPTSCAKEGKKAAPAEPLPTDQPDAPAPRMYRRTHKEPVPHTWRTRQDPFGQVWEQIRLQLQINPAQTAKELLEELQRRHPDQFGEGQLRTLQRRVRDWRRGELYSEEALRHAFYTNVLLGENTPQIASISE
jgi:hypothetical protein